MTEWYDELREHYRPDRIRVLLIAESPPDPGAQDRRFFYSPILTRHDNLYRGVASAFFGSSRTDPSDKPSVLEELQRNGVWLIDASDAPVNHLSRAQRAEAVRAALPVLLSRATACAPEFGAIICTTPIFKLASGPLDEGGLTVLHDEPLPFPLGNHRARFVAGVRAALDGVGWQSA